jgi:hypothetical protein
MLFRSGRKKESAGNLADADTGRVTSMERKRNVRIEEELVLVALLQDLSHSA